MNLDCDPYKKYIDMLKNEMNTRENKSELEKRLIITDDASFFLESMISTEEYNILIQELGEDGYWYYPLSSKDEIAKILHPKNCKDILLQKRAEYIVDHSRTRRVFLKRKELYEKAGRPWSLSSYYDEDKHFSNFLNLLKPNVKRACKKVEAGFVFMTEANGICEKTEYGNIIYLSESLSYFLHYMNLAFLTFDGIEMNQQQRHEALLIGLRVMLGVESLDFDLDPRYDTLPKEVIAENNVLVNQQLSFIIGHEYAHHALGHLSSSKLYNISSNEIFSSDGSKCKIYNYSQQKEFEADWYALKHTKLKNEAKSEILNSAFLFFIYLDVYHHIIEYLSPSSSTYKSHPEPLERLWRLRRQHTRYIGYSKQELNEFIDYANSIKEYFTREVLPYQTHLLEFQGSVYISGYKTKKMVDRIDF